MTDTFGKVYLAELEAEKTASRKCLERIPLPKLEEYKPHDKSMKMFNLCLVVADLPRWIAYMINKGDIDFQTWKAPEVKTTEDLVALYDKNMKDAKEALANVTDEELEKTFNLKNGEQVLMSLSKKDTISQSINHLVHHRGQLTVYMRLNDIAVPSIYGPSADEKSF